MRTKSVFAAMVIALAAAPAVSARTPPAPVFEDGQAQPVFDPADVVRQNLWVPVGVDSDHDGVPDRVHVEVVRPRATEAGLKVPVVLEASPYNDGYNDVVNHNVDVELDPPPVTDAPPLGAHQGSGPVVPRIYEQYLLARGYAVAYADSLGTAGSTGCPTVGGTAEITGARSAVDWLAGRTSAQDATGTTVRAGWSTGSIGMMGGSHDGTLAEAVAATGVAGLDAIVPMSAAASWYGYYRAGGAVVGPDGYLGEDLDIDAQFTYTRQDRAVCLPEIDHLRRIEDRATGDYNAAWDERNYLKDAGRVRAAVLQVHGLLDENVRLTQATQWYDAIKTTGVPHRMWLFQGGHTDPSHTGGDAWYRTLNRWLTRYLYHVPNGVESEPKLTIEREDQSWHQEADWPVPGTADATLWPGSGGPARGSLGLAHRAGTEHLTDDANVTAEQLANAPASPHRLLYAGPALRTPLRLSGTATANLSLAFDRPAANVTTLLLDRAPDGTGVIVARGWADPRNRDSISTSSPVVPGHSYSLTVHLDAADHVSPAGHTLEFVLLSSDHDHTLRPHPGAQLSLDLAKTHVHLPIVGGPAALRAALGG